MSEIVLKAADVVDLIRAKVAEFGADYVYKADQRDENDDVSPECYYVEDGCPSCLVGHVLVDAGLTVEQVAVFDTQYDGLPGIPNMLQFPEGVRVTDRARFVMSQAQRAQDYGHTWGSALEDAEHAANDTFFSDEID